MQIDDKDLFQAITDEVFIDNGNNEVTSGITYQWKKGDTILTGQTNKTLEVSAEDIDTTQVYNCVVTLADV